jgi:hypothetical protein
MELQALPYLLTAKEICDKHMNLTGANLQLSALMQFPAFGGILGSYFLKNFPGAKARPGHDADHSPPYCAEIENE